MTTQTKELIVVNTLETFEAWLAIEKIKKKIDVARLGEAVQAMQPFVEEVKNQAIKDKNSLDEVVAKTKALKKVRALIKGFLEPEVKELYIEYTGKRDVMNGFSKPLEAIEKQKKKEMIAYEREQERIRKEEEAKALKKAEEEAREEKKLLEKEALEAMDKGDEEEAELKAAQAEQVSPQDHIPAQKPAYMPPQGTSIRENWKAEVTDMMALIKAVAADPNLINCLTPNQTYLNQRARSDKDNLKIPGVRVWNEGSVSMRTS
jgi:hypothetical protein